MNILLRQKYSYDLAGSFDFTKKRFEELLGSTMFNLSKRYSGAISDDGRFTFKQKVIFFDITKFGESVYLKGKLNKKGKGSTITISLSPNIFLVLLIYLIPLLWLNIFFGGNSFFSENSRFQNFIMILLFDLFLLLLIQIRKFFLKRSFEKAIVRRDYSSFDHSFSNAPNDNIT